MLKLGDGLGRRHLDAFPNESGAGGVKGRVNNVISEVSSKKLTQLREILVVTGVQLTKYLESYFLQAFKMTLHR